MGPDVAPSGAPENARDVLPTHGCRRGPHDVGPDGPAVHRKKIRNKGWNFTLEAGIKYIRLREETMRRRVLLDAAPHAVLVLILVLLVGLRLWPRHSRGFRVRIASDTCVGFRSGIEVLRITGEGRLLLDGGAVGIDALASELSDIYGAGSRRVMFFAAEDNVPFQRIAEVIDVVQQATQTRVPPLPEALRNSAADNLNIELRLVSPGAVNTPCNRDSYNWWKEGLHISAD